MRSIFDFLLNGLNKVWPALISDPVKSIGALAATVSAFAAIGGLIIGWKNFRKDATRVCVTAKRAQNGPLIFQYPKREFILFEVFNQLTSSVVINEVGIIAPTTPWGRKFINLVDLPHAYLETKGQENAIGTLECIGIPGIVPAKSTGIFLIDYSSMRDAVHNYQKRDMLPDSLDFVGSRRLIKTFKEFQNLQDRRGKFLQIVPYVRSGSGEYFAGRKVLVKLGVLSDVIA